jgi:acid stress-induced BolA-like protein IbaG/YrbA
MMIQHISSDGRYEIIDEQTYFAVLILSKLCTSQVHIEGEGVGFIVSCLGPFFSGVRFEVQVMRRNFCK